MSDESDDVSRVGFVDRLAFLSEDFVGAGEADAFASSLVNDEHIAGKFPRADAEESDAVTVSRVHVGLDFENETGESAVEGDRTNGGRLGVLGGCRLVTSLAWLWGEGFGEKGFE